MRKKTRHRTPRILLLLLQQLLLLLLLLLLLHPSWKLCSCSREGSRVYTQLRLQLPCANAR